MRVFERVKSCSRSLWTRCRRERPEESRKTRYSSILSVIRRLSAFLFILYIVFFLLCYFLLQITFPLCAKYVDDWIMVSEEEIGKAVVFMLQHHQKVHTVYIHWT